MLLLAPILEAPRINDLGVFWQGRYDLPLSLAVPLIVATRPGVATAIESAAGRVATLTAVLWLVGQVAAFLSTYHRFATGFGGPLLPLHPDWQPPGGYATVVAFVLWCTGIAAALRRVAVARTRVDLPVVA
jgi:hypothetical protein